MSQQVKLGVFERPGADFILRRTLELLTGAERARALMAQPSRFVLFVPVPGDEAKYVRCATLDELFRAIGVAWVLLSRKGVRHIHLARTAEPDTERLIDEAAIKMEELARPPAANDP